MEKPNHPPEALAAPRPATVLAIGLSPRQGVLQTGRDVRAGFTTLISGALGHNCHLQAASAINEEFALTAIVPESAQTLALLRRVQSVQEEFMRNHPDTLVRFIVHHGIVFQAANGHAGSAVRSAHSRLARLPRNALHAATIDFVAYTETWPSRSIAFEDLAGVPESSGLVNFTMNVQTTAKRTAAASQQASLLAFLTNRLAVHLGPFAEVLVSAAQRSSATPNQLIEELSREIDEPAARQVFLAEANDYLDRAAAHPETQHPK